MRLIIPVLLNCLLVLGVYLIDKHTPAKKLPYITKQVIIGILFGCVSAFACSLFSPFYMLSPMVFILVHCYNGEPGEENAWLKHLAYPVMLLTFGVLSVYVL